MLIIIICVGDLPDSHSLAKQAMAGMQLFKKYYGKSPLLAEAKQKLQRTPREQSFAKTNNYRYEGDSL